MGLILPSRLTRQPQQPVRVDPSIGADFAWLASNPNNSVVGPAISSKSTTGKATPAGVAVSNGYVIASSAAIPSLYATTWTEIGVVFLDGSNDLVTLSVRDDGQAVFFRPSTPKVDLVMWGIIDVDINGVLPVGVVNYVAKRSGNSHSVWLNGKLYGTASASNTPSASTGVKPAIGAAAGSGGAMGNFPLVATTGVLFVMRTTHALPDAQCQQLSANPWQVFQPPQRRLLVESGTATVPTGTFASTLDNATIAASGTVADIGSFASTLGSAIMAASGSVGSVPSGAFASTLAGFTMAATGTLNDSGTIASTMQGCAMAAAGIVAPNVTGTFASTMDGAQMFAGGFVGTPPVITGVIMRRRLRPRVYQRTAAP